MAEPLNWNVRSDAWAKHHPFYSETSQPESRETLFRACFFNHPLSIKTGFAHKFCLQFTLTKFILNQPWNIMSYQQGDSLPTATPLIPIKPTATVTTAIDMFTYEQIIQEIAARYGLDWRILVELAYRESRFNAQAIGQQGEIGLMQIKPSTWQEWSPKLGPIDPYDPYSNVLVGTAYLMHLREYFARLGYPEPHWSLVAYNWGPRNVREVLEAGGDWQQVSLKPRQYALGILQQVEQGQMSLTVRFYLRQKVADPKRP